MKTIKRKFILPALVVFLAVGAAFAGQFSIGEAESWVPGYYQTNTPCDTEIHCGTSGIKGCLAPNGVEAKGMNGSLCQVPLFRLN